MEPDVVFNYWTGKDVGGRKDGATGEGDSSNPSAI